MKKVTLFFASLLFASGLVFAQTNNNEWKEMADFQYTMNNAFTPIKTNNFDVLKENVPQLYRQAKYWYASAETAGRFSKPETMKTMESLMIRCNDLWAAVEDKTSNNKIKAMTSEIQSLFNKVTADIKK